MKVLTINPTEGLANRMRAIASGIFLAGELNADFRIIWAVNDELYARFDDIFEVPDLMKGRIYYPGKAEYGLKYSVPRKKNLYISALSLLRYDRKLIYGTPDWRITQSDGKEPVLQYFEGGEKNFIQGGTIFFPFEEELFRGLFIPVKSIRDEVDVVIKEMGEERTGIHIRRTDNKESILHSPTEDFEAKIRSIISERPGMKFYLATDSDEIKSEFRQKFGNRIYCNENMTSRKTQRGMKDAVREMYILSQCNAIFGSYYSSYSEAAAMLGNIPMETIYKP